MFVTRSKKIFAIFVVIMVTVIAAPDKCSIKTIGTKTSLRIPLRLRAYAAHTEEFIIEVTDDVCTSGKYSGAELLVCVDDYMPFIYTIDAHHARVRADPLSDLSGQYYVYINAYC